MVSPAAANQLVIQRSHRPTATAGVAFSTQPVIYVEDQYGNLETGDNTTQVTADAQQRHRSAARNHDGDGLGRHRHIHRSVGQHGRDHLAPVHQHLRVLTAAISNNIVVSPAAASQLVIETEPSPTATAGVAFVTQPVIVRRRPVRQSGDRRQHHPGDGRAAAWAPDPLQGTTTVTVSGGIATFTNLSDDTAETISLQFTSSPAL